MQDDSSVDVFNVDTTNKTVTSYNQKIASLAGTGTRMVVADSNGNLSADLGDNAINMDFLTSTPASTYINVNGYSRGKTVMLYFSFQWGAGNATSSGVYMLRCGYDGGNYSVVNIAENGSFLPTFSVLGGILYITMTTNGSGRLRTVANK